MGRKIGGHVGGQTKETNSKVDTQAPVWRWLRVISDKQIDE